MSMRDEDLKNLPQSIEGWRVAEMFKQLGISDYKNVMELTVEPREIRARVLATDERGHPYAVESTEMIPVLDLGQTEPQFVPGGSFPRAATHEISIRVVGPWEKPAPEVEPKYEQDSAGCPEIWPEEGADWPCELPAGHGRLDLHAAHVGGVLKRW